MSAMNEISIAITLSISCSPSPVPRAAASSTFTSVRGMSTFTPPRVSGTPVSGSRIFAIMIVPGAVMMTAVRRCRASIPNAMYAAMIEPETCAIPAVITVINSESVMRGRKGRIVSGASVCPMKIDAARSHDLVHPDRERLHHDLHDAEVVHDREQRGDEDDRGHDLEREHDADARVLLADFAEDEFRAGVGEAENLRHGGAEPAEDLLA